MNRDCNMEIRELSETELDLASGGMSLGTEIALGLGMYYGAFYLPVTGVAALGIADVVAAFK